MSSFRKINRPEPQEHNAFFQHYLDLVPTGEAILEQLQDNFHRLELLVCTLSEEQLLFRYAEGKWSIKEVLVHLMDVERIFTYRALRYARKDQSPLPGFSEDDYVPASEADARSLQDILEEYTLLRDSTLQFFQNLPQNALLRRGKALDGEGRVLDSASVRAMVYFIAGHELHHIKLIKERYLMK